MKIAVFSDIHGNYQALTAILDDINKKGIQKIYCLGDNISIGPNSKECLDLIMKNNIKMVLGNHEIYFTRGTQIDKKADREQKDHNN
jgi:predicted phosphodiesterase